MLEGYEALSDLPVEEVEVETPLETCMTPVLAGRKLAIVPILRAGLGMVQGVLSLVPSAKVGHIGMYRDEETWEPTPYYCKLPHPIEERLIVVTDPMLATGGSAVDAVNQDDIRRVAELITDVDAYSGTLVSKRDLDLEKLIKA